MNKLNVGDYVRTKSNGIQKIDEEGRVNLGLIRPSVHVIKKEEIIKSSPNIIDLIERNDLITLTSKYCEDEVYRVIGNLKGLIELDLFEDGTMQITKDEDIKSVVTHEQFENISYKVGE